MMILLLAKPASSQTNPLIGSWRLIAADKILPDGSRVSDYGTAPHGIAIFTTEGNYVVEIFGTVRTKFASGNATTGTPEEYRSATLSHSVHFGTYGLDSSKGTISFNIDRASYPNWDETTQVRNFTIKGDTLSWRVPPRPDGATPISVFKRIQ
ncbi:lipocalin-like domain-containing protein [Pseudoflavitalea sp. G-6-1-2]|nr:lipocalin-like domain-containing protein [Pseudoflavitalea sp. G-6-1-2]